MEKQFDQINIDKDYELFRLYEASKAPRKIGRFVGRSSSTIS